MSEELPFKPTPETAGLSSDAQTTIVDVVMHYYPPGTPAPPRPGRERLYPWKQTPPSEDAGSEPKPDAE